MKSQPFALLSYTEVSGDMKRAFTLIELLVVIAIIAIIAALLFPVFASAKAAAKKTQCVSNLKQIGSAILLYMESYDDIFPHAVDPSDKFRPEIWNSEPEFQARIPYMPMLHEALQPYLKNKNVFQCPADNGSNVLDSHPWIDFQCRPSVYKIYETSYLFRTEIAFKYFSQTQFQLPADVNVLFDTSGHWHSSTRPIQTNDDSPTIYRLLNSYSYNTLFGDMHVRSLKYPQLQRAWSTSL